MANVSPKSQTDFRIVGKRNPAAVPKAFSFSIFVASEDTVVDVLGFSFTVAKNYTPYKALEVSPSIAKSIHCFWLVAE